jgi:hypothetical protein
MLTVTESSDKHFRSLYYGVSKSFRTGCLERELQMVQLSATRCSCITTLWVSLFSFAAITFCVTSQQVFIVAVVYFIMTETSGYSLVFHFLSVSAVPRRLYTLQLAHFLRRCVQNGSGAHPASYPTGTGGSFPGSKATKVWSWPLTSIQCRG